MDGGGRRRLIAVVLAAGGAVLGVAGVGHAYLRAWRRALVWFLSALFLGVSLLLVGIEGDPPASLFDLPTPVLGALAFLFLLSVIDAYLVAGNTDRTREDDRGNCPHCGRETDPELEFCSWCAEPLPDAGDSGTDGEFTAR